MTQLTDRINLKREILAEEDWGVTDYKRRRLGLRRVKETFEHVPGTAYKSYPPGKYVVFIAETLRNGVVLESGRPRVFFEGHDYEEERLASQFALRCDQTRERALAKGASHAG